MRFGYAPILLLLLICAGTRAADGGVDRILRRIDFEERRLGNPEELPMHWNKVEGPLMPHYAAGQFATDRKRSGNYSFRFDLDGGSVVYRYDPGQIKVYPAAHYRVECYVQTTVLQHARARLTTYFADIDGHAIKSSIRHSELYAAKAADEPWKLLFVELSSERRADSLVVELELLQPELYEAPKLGSQALFPQDIHGSAWFDDVLVSQVPKVKMSTDRPGNIFRRGEALSLSVLVNDRSTDDLAGQLVVKDAAGETVYQRSGALEGAAAENLGPGLKSMKMVLPQLRPGWYEASLLMTSRGALVGRQTIDLVLLADSATYVRPDDRFGLIGTDLPYEGWTELPDILPLLGAGRVKLAVWNKQGDVHDVDSAGFDKLLVRLGELRITPTACLLDLPPAIADKLDGDGWLKLLSARDEDWQPQLAVMIARHANHLDRWQLGVDGTDLFVTKPRAREVYTRIYDQFAKLVQKPDLAMPWPAWYEFQGQLPATVALSVHASILPQQMPLYMQDLKKQEGHNLSLSLQLLDRQRYGREVQIRDLVQRVIYALAADAQRIDLPLPFNVFRAEDGHVVKEPQELLIVTRTLMMMLSGTTFKGKVPIAENVEAFLFDKNGQGILVLWDKGQQSGDRQLALTLGESPCRVDLWGNVTPLPRQNSGNGNQLVQLAVGPMPIFLVDIDGQLAQLRASLGFDRPLIESSFQPHTRKIRFVNPYRTSIGGTLKLKAPPGWTLNPPMFTFSVNPGEKFERDLSIEFPYNSFAGPKIIEAEFNIQDSSISTTVPITMNLGLSDVGMQTMAIRDGNDVLVQQLITNYGEKPIDYTAFAVYPAKARQERLVTNLAPGRSTIKIYRFANVPASSAKVRTGIKEMEGTRILNDEVEIQ